MPSNNKLFFGAAFLILVAAVLVSCSSFEVNIEPVPRRHNDKTHNHQQHHRHNNNHKSRFFDETFNAKPDAIKKELFGGKDNTNVSSSSKAFPLGTAVTFAPSFFQNLFNVIIMPEVRKLVTDLKIPTQNFGLPMGGRGSVSVNIPKFDITLASLKAVYPSQFMWELSNIEIEIDLQWSAKWQLKICFFHCWHITLFHCSGPLDLNSNNIEISGTMQFAYDPAQATVQVESPTNAIWKNTPSVHISAHCGWFWDAMLHILKFFGLNVWGDVQKAVNGAIKNKLHGGVLANKINEFFGKTLNAAFHDLKICNYAFYPGENFISVFTRDPIGICLDTILPKPWLATPPNYDITLLGRISLWPDFLPPKNWSLHCLPLPHQWFQLPDGLNSMIDIEEVVTCLGSDSNLGVYVVGQVDVKFIAPAGDSQQQLLGSSSSSSNDNVYLEQANRQIALRHSQEESKFQQYVKEVNDKYEKKLTIERNQKCSLFGAFMNQDSQLSSSTSGENLPWWACVDLPLLEKVLSFLPVFVIAFSSAAFVYYKRTSRIANEKKNGADDNNKKAVEMF